MREEKYADLVWDYDEAAHETFMENLAPIVLFTYNRLEHTKKTIEALQQNLYAKDSELYIYSDAPKYEAAKESVESVRAFLHQVDGFRKVHIIERGENWGLARNIIDGVTSIVNKYGKIIVLEDDIVTSRYFLKYMNDALEVYKDEERVMEINGYMPQIKTEGILETFFLEYADCWGWATWARAWKYFRREPEAIRDSFTREEIFKFNLNGEYDFWDQIIANCEGRIYTWAIFWHAAIFKNKGLSLMVRDSLVDNNGMDGSGEHCSMTGAFKAKINDKPIVKYPLTIQENKFARANFEEFFRRLKPSKWQRLKNKIKMLLGK